MQSRAIGNFPRNRVPHWRIASGAELSRNVIPYADIPDASEGVIRPLSYTYSYGRATDGPERIRLVRDPSNLHERRLSELRWDDPLARRTAIRERIGVCRQFDKSRPTGGRYEDFSKEALTAPDELGPVDSEVSWRVFSSESAPTGTLISVT